MWEDKKIKRWLSETVQTFQVINDWQEKRKKLDLTQNTKYNFLFPACIDSA